MVFNFTREDAVLNFGPRKPREHAKRSSREYILWPAWSYRVVAPRVRDRQLNVFQRAALGLCKAGQQNYTTIGRRLSIHSDLAALILDELSKLGYLDGDGLATHQGLEVLENDAHDLHEMVAGYVFQDPWTGELWPRFVDQFDYCELEFNEGGFPKLMMGTRGKPRRQSAFMVLPNGAPTPTQPSPDKVVSAVAGHRKGRRYADDLSEWEEDFTQSGYSPSTVHFDRVSLIEVDPIPVFLMTYLYLTETTSRTGNWHACDPFGLGASVLLRRRVEQVMDKVPGLHNVVNRLVGRGVHEGLEEQQRWVSELRERAELEVEKRLSVNIKEHGAFNQIVEMEFARQEVSLLGKDCPEFKVHSVLRACLKCLEAIFGDMARTHPLGDVWERVYVPRRRSRKGKGLEPLQDRDWLKANYEAAATNVGFAEPIPESLLNIRPGQIRAVAVSGEHWRLRPLVMASILLAQRTTPHPLRAAAQVAPGILRDIEEIARQGGKAGHVHGDQKAVSDVSTTVELTYTVLSILSGLGVDPKSTRGKE